MPALVVSSVSGTVYALRGTDGTVLWHRHLAHTTTDMRMAQSGRLLIALTADGVLHALRLRDGVKLWGIRLPENPEEPQDPWFRMARIFPRLMADERYALIQSRRQIVLLESWSGRVLWRYVSYAQRPQLIGLGPLHAFVLEASVHESFDRSIRPVRPHARTENIEMHALALEDGMTDWTTRDHVARESHVTGLTSLAESGGQVYSFGVTTLCSLAADTGELIWTQEVGSPGALGRLALGAEHVVVATASDVSIHDKHRGVRMWSAFDHTEDTGTKLVGNIVTDTDAIYIAKQDLNRVSQIEARNIATGLIRWIWPAADQPDSQSPALTMLFCGAGGLLYTPVESSINPNQISVCAIHSRDSQMQWVSHEPSDMGVLLPIDSALAEHIENSSY